MFLKPSNFWKVRKAERMVLVTFGEKGIFEMYSVPTALYIFYLSSFFLYIKIHIGEAQNNARKKNTYISK